MDVDNKELVAPLEDSEKEVVDAALITDVAVGKLVVEDEVDLVDMMDAKELEIVEVEITEDVWVVKEVVDSAIFGTIIVVANVDEGSVSVVVSRGWAGTGVNASCDVAAELVVFSNLLSGLPVISIFSYVMSPTTYKNLFALSRLSGPAAVRVHKERKVASARVICIFMNKYNHSKNRKYCWKV